VIRTLRKIIGRKNVVSFEKEASEAYDLWASSYDKQPENLMLHFDEAIFSELLTEVEIKNKKVADIGCGTGRHWNKILMNEPEQLEGLDVSNGMLEMLKEKFPTAKLSLIQNNLLTFIDDASFDVIISTLTIAHIQNIEEAIATWSRILKPSAEIIITDFHPSALAIGGKRTFTNDGQVITVTNYIHTVEKIKNLFIKYGFEVVGEEQRIIDEAVKHYYVHQKALDVFNRFYGVPMIYGLHLKRVNDIK
jgi:ubiquinone/menaquinone biosynthesis C-methylase UbiE